MAEMDCVLLYQQPLCSTEKVRVKNVGVTLSKLDGTALSQNHTKAS